ncbi:MAG TPA: SDR family NAD(P)-dependent oxidoreductase [Ktedonobacterales bacterium]|nr:SDR family NAD(P)-dependent oxidoreductase [Ktedonobacterales bacterium]
MTERLDGTVALVTGASSGIGAATARTLANRGAAVALAARRAEQLQQLADEITGRGGRALVLATDITDKTQAQAAVARTMAELRRLDILVNNAGVALLGPIEGAPLDEWEQMVQLNVLGLLYITHAALPHLLQAAEDAPRRVADLVNVSSVAGRVARSGGGVYEVTKFGVVAFSESLRQEVTKRHVRVSVVEPGTVATEIFDHEREAVREQVLQRFSGFEPLVAEDIADAIAYSVTRPRRVAINELLIRPTEQE